MKLSDATGSSQKIWIGALIEDFIFWAFNLIDPIIRLLFTIDDCLQQYGDSFEGGVDSLVLYFAWQLIHDSSTIQIRSNVIEPLSLSYFSSNHPKYSAPLPPSNRSYIKKSPKPQKPSSHLPSFSFPPYNQITPKTIYK